MSEHICFVLENFYPDFRAGTETYVLNLAKGLLAKNWQVSVIIAAVGKKSFQYKYEGINIYALSVPDKISPAELNGLKKPSNLTEFQEKIAEIKPDIVHFHSFSRSFMHFHLKSAFNYGAIVFFTAHLGGIFCARGDLLYLGKKQCDAKIRQFRCSVCFAFQKYNLPKSFLGATFSFIPYLRKKRPALNIIPNKLLAMQYLSEYTHRCISIAQWIDKIFKINKIKQSTIISQAIDTSKFTISDTEIKNKKLTLGFIGRMNPSKGFHVLLSALQINNIYSEFELQVITINDSTEKMYYNEMKQKFYSFNYHLWKENLNHTQLNKEMNNWDMLVLPSFYEVAPLVILESFAKKIPVIGSDYPAITEMVKNKQTGLIFRNGDSSDLAEKLKCIVNDTNLVSFLKNNIKKPKNIEQLINEHIQLYKKYL
ncbi:MAG: glycosyltransferase family 4 protein [Bacteroidales bacterium]|nr:glycosyltransferase family 4 protein [Bacteroidales bacterium]